MKKKKKKPKNTKASKDSKAKLKRKNNKEEDKMKKKKKKPKNTKARKFGLKKPQKKGLEKTVKSKSENGKKKKKKKKVNKNNAEGKKKTTKKLNEKTQKSKKLKPLKLKNSQQSTAGKVKPNNLKLRKKGGGDTKETTKRICKTQTKKCSKAGAYCIHYKDECTTEVLPKLCKGASCQCCKLNCTMPKKKCTKVKGKCGAASECKKGKGTILPNGCNGKGCVCCYGKDNPCKPRNKCKKANGECVAAASCKSGNVIPKGCKGKGCVCCPKSDCKIKNKCNKAKGKCGPEADCTDGTIIPKGCKGKDCACCAPTPPCKSKKKCKNKNGVCQLSSTCDGTIVKKGCKGGCTCCAPVPPPTTKCKSKKKCENANGVCQLSSSCDGTIKEKGCDAGCTCCVPDDPVPTPPPVTLPPPGPDTTAEGGPSGGGPSGATPDGPVTTAGAGPSGAGSGSGTTAGAGPSGATPVDPIITSGAGPSGATPGGPITTAGVGPSGATPGGPVTTAGAGPSGATPGGPGTTAGAGPSGATPGGPVTTAGAGLSGATPGGPVTTAGAGPSGATPDGPVTTAGAGPSGATPGGPVTTAGAGPSGATPGGPVTTAGAGPSGATPGGPVTTAGAGPSGATPGGPVTTAGAGPSGTTPGGPVTTAGAGPSGATPDGSVTTAAAGPSSATSPDDSATTTPESTKPQTTQMTTGKDTTKSITTTILTTLQPTTTTQKETTDKPTTTAAATTKKDTTTTQSPTTTTNAASTSTSGPSVKTQLEQALEAIKALQAQVQALLNAVNSGRRKRESENKNEINHRSKRAVDITIVDTIKIQVKKWSFSSKYYNTTEGISKISEYTQRIKSIKSEVVSGGTIDNTGTAKLKSLTKSSLSVVTVIKVEIKKEKKTTQLVQKTSTAGTIKQLLTDIKTKFASLKNTQVSKSTVEAVVLITKSISKTGIGSINIATSKKLTTLLEDLNKAPTGDTADSSVFNNAISEVNSAVTVSETLVTTIQVKKTKDMLSILESNSKRVVTMIKNKLSAIEIQIKSSVASSSKDAYESSKISDILIILKEFQKTSSITEEQLTTLEEFEDEADLCIEEIKSGSKGSLKDTKSFKETTTSVLKTIKKKVEETNAQEKITEKAETASEVSNYIFIISDYTSQLTIGTETSTTITNIKVLIENILTKKWNVELIEEFEQYTLELEDLIESGNGVSGVSELTKTITEKSSEVDTFATKYLKKEIKMHKVIRINKVVKYTKSIEKRIKQVQSGKGKSGSVITSMMVILKKWSSSSANNDEITDENIEEFERLQTKFFELLAAGGTVDGLSKLSTSIKTTISSTNSRLTALEKAEETQQNLEAMYEAEIILSDIETWFSTETSFKDGELTDISFVKLIKVLKEWKLGLTHIKVSQLETLEGVYEIFDTVTISEVAGLQSVVTEVKSVKESIVKETITVEKEYISFDTQSLQKETSDLISTILTYFNKKLRSSDTTSVETEYTEVTKIREQIKVISSNISSVTEIDLDKLWELFVILESTTITGRVKGFSEVVSLLENTKKSYIIVVEKNEKMFVSESSIYESVWYILETIKSTMTDIQVQNSGASSGSEVIEYDEIEELNTFLAYFVESEDITSVSESDLELLESYQELIISLYEDSLETDVIGGVDIFFKYEVEVKELITISIEEAKEQMESYEQTYLFYEVQSEIETIIYKLSIFAEETSGTTAVSKYESDFIDIEAIFNSIETNASSVSESIHIQITRFLDILYIIEEEGILPTKVDIVISSAKKTEQTIKKYITEVVEAESTLVEIKATVTKVVSYISSFISRLDIFINESISKEQLTMGENERVTYLIFELEHISSNIEYITNEDIQYFEELWEELKFSDLTGGFGNILDLQLTTETLIIEANTKIEEINSRSEYKEEITIVSTKSEKLIEIQKKVKEITKNILSIDITSTTTSNEISEYIIIIKKITTSGISSVTVEELNVIIIFFKSFTVTAGVDITGLAEFELIISESVRIAVKEKESLISVLESQTTINTLTVVSSTLTSINEELSFYIGVDGSEEIEIYIITELYEIISEYTVEYIDSYFIQYIETYYEEIIFELSSLEQNYKITNLEGLIKRITKLSFSVTSKLEEEKTILREKQELTLLQKTSSAFFEINKVVSSLLKETVVTTVISEEHIQIVEEFMILIKKIERGVKITNKEIIEIKRLTMLLETIKISAEIKTKLEINIVIINKRYESITQELTELKESNSRNTEFTIQTTGSQLLEELVYIISEKQSTVGYASRFEKNADITDINIFLKELSIEKLTLEQITRLESYLIIITELEVSKGVGITGLAEIERISSTYVKEIKKSVSTTLQVQHIETQIKLYYRFEYVFEELLYTFKEITTSVTVGENKYILELLYLLSIETHLLKEEHIIRIEELKRVIIKIGVSITDITIITNTIKTASESIKVSIKKQKEKGEKLYKVEALSSTKSSLLEISKLTESITELSFTGEAVSNSKMSEFFLLLKEWEYNIIDITIESVSILEIYILELTQILRKKENVKEISEIVKITNSVVASISIEIEIIQKESARKERLEYIQESQVTIDILISLLEEASEITGGLDSDGPIISYNELDEITYLLLEIQRGTVDSFIVSELKRYVTIFRESILFMEEGDVIIDLRYIYSLSVEVEIMIQKEIIEEENYLIYKEELYYKKEAVSILRKTVTILEQISVDQWLLSVDIYNELYLILSKITTQNIVKYYFRIEEVFYKISNVTSSSEDGRAVGQLLQSVNSIIVKVSISISESNSVSYKQERLEIYSQVNFELQEIETLLYDIQMLSTGIAGGNTLSVFGFSNFTNILEIDFELYTYESVLIVQEFKKQLIQIFVMIATEEKEYNIEGLNNLHIQITKTITELSQVIIEEQIIIQEEAQTFLTYSLANSVVKYKKIVFSFKSESTSIKEIRYDSKVTQFAFILETMNLKFLTAQDIEIINQGYYIIENANSKYGSGVAYIDQIHSKLQELSFYAKKNIEFTENLNREKNALRILEESSEKLTTLHSSFKTFISKVSSTTEYTEVSNVTYLYNLLVGGINGYSFPNNFLSLLSEFSTSVFEGITTNIMYVQEIIDISVELNSSITSVSQSIESFESTKLCTQFESVTYKFITLLEDIDSEGAGNEGSLFLNEINNDENSMESSKENSRENSTESSMENSKENGTESSKEISRNSTESIMENSKENSTENSKESSKENSKERPGNKETSKEDKKRKEKRKKNNKLIKNIIKLYIRFSKSDQSDKKLIHKIITKVQSLLNSNVDITISRNIVFEYISILEKVSVKIVGIRKTTEAQQKQQKFVSVIQDTNNLLEDLKSVLSGFAGKKASSEVKYIITSISEIIQTWSQGVYLISRESFTKVKVLLYDLKALRHKTGTVDIDISVIIKVVKVTHTLVQERITVQTTYSSSYSEEREVQVSSVFQSKEVQDIKRTSQKYFLFQEYVGMLSTAINILTNLRTSISSSSTEVSVYGDEESILLYLYEVLSVSEINRENIELNTLTSLGSALSAVNSLISRDQIVLNETFISYLIEYTSELNVTFQSSVDELSVYGEASYHLQVQIQASELISATSYVLREWYSSSADIEYDGSNAVGNVTQAAFDDLFRVTMKWILQIGSATKYEIELVRYSLAYLQTVENIQGKFIHGIQKWKIVINYNVNSAISQNVHYVSLYDVVDSGQVYIYSKSIEVSKEFNRILYSFLNINSLNVDKILKKRLDYIYEDSIRLATKWAYGQVEDYEIQMCREITWELEDLVIVLKNKASQGNDNNGTCDEFYSKEDNSKDKSKENSSKENSKESSKEDGNESSMEDSSKEDSDESGIPDECIGGYYGFMIIKKYTKLYSVIRETSYKLNIRLREKENQLIENEIDIELYYYHYFLIQIESVFENVYEKHELSSNETSSAMTNSSITDSIEYIISYLKESSVHENKTSRIYEEVSIFISESQNGSITFSSYELDRIHELLTILKTIIFQIESKINIRNYEKVTRISSNIIAFMREHKKLKSENRKENIWIENDYKSENNSKYNSENNTEDTWGESKSKSENNREDIWEFSDDMVMNERKIIDEELLTLASVISGVEKSLYGIGLRVIREYSSGTLLISRAISEYGFNILYLSSIYKNIINIKLSAQNYIYYTKKYSMISKEKIVFERAENILEEFITIFDKSVKQENNGTSNSSSTTNNKQSTDEHENLQYIFDTLLNFSSSANKIKHDIEINVDFDQLLMIDFEILKTYNESNMDIISKIHNLVNLLTNRYEFIKESSKYLSKLDVIRKIIATHYIMQNKWQNIALYYLYSRDSVQNTTNTTLNTNLTQDAINDTMTVDVLREILVKNSWALEEKDIERMIGYAEYTLRTFSISSDIDKSDFEELTRKYEIIFQEYIADVGYLESAIQITEFNYNLMEVRKLTEMVLSALDLYTSENATDIIQSVEFILEDWVQNIYHINTISLNKYRECVIHLISLASVDGEYLLESEWIKEYSNVIMKETIEELSFTSAVVTNVEMISSDRELYIEEEAIKFQQKLGLVVQSSYVLNAFKKILINIAKYLPCGYDDEMFLMSTPPMPTSSMSIQTTPEPSTPRADFNNTYDEYDGKMKKESLLSQLQDFEGQFDKLQLSTLSHFVKYIKEYKNEARNSTEKYTNNDLIELSKYVFKLLRSITQMPLQRKLEHAARHALVKQDALDVLLSLTEVLRKYIYPHEDFTHNTTGNYSTTSMSSQSSISSSSSMATPSSMASLSSMSSFSSTYSSMSSRSSSPSSSSTYSYNGSLFENSTHTPPYKTLLEEVNFILISWMYDSNSVDGLSVFKLRHCIKKLKELREKDWVNCPILKFTLFNYNHSLTNILDQLYVKSYTTTSKIFEAIQRYERTSKSVNNYIKFFDSDYESKENTPYTTESTPPVPSTLSSSSMNSTDVPEDDDDESDTDSEYMVDENEELRELLSNKVMMLLGFTGDILDVWHILIDIKSYDIKSFNNYLYELKELREYINKIETEDIIMEQLFFSKIIRNDTLLAIDELYDFSYDFKFLTERNLHRSYFKHLIAFVRFTKDYVSEGFNFTTDGNTTDTVNATYNKYNMTNNATDDIFYDPCENEGLVCYSILLLEAVKKLEYNNATNDDGKSSIASMPSTTIPTFTPFTRNYSDIANPCEQMIEEMEEKKKKTEEYDEQTYLRWVIQLFAKSLSGFNKKEVSDDEVKNVVYILDDILDELYLDSVFINNTDFNHPDFSLYFRDTQYNEYQL